MHSLALVLRRLRGRALALAAAALFPLVCPAAVHAGNAEFREASEPAGIVSRTTYPDVGSLATTVTAPPTTAGYRFTHWTIAESRANDLTGRAANPVTFTVAGPTLAVAHYLPATQDSDADSLPDAFEVEFFGTLELTPASDPDGDGFDIAAELAYGLHPLVVDERAPGGVSRRRDSALFVVAPGVGDATATYGGISRRRFDLRMVILDPAYAFLQERSDPPGLVSADRVVLDGSTVQLSTAPDPNSGCRFTGWLRDGVRLDQPTQKQPISITVSGDTTVTARYVAEGADTDGDGLADWVEWYSFNTLSHGPGDDPDLDGLPTDLELFRGYSAWVHDDLADGGVSRRRSAIADVDLTGNVLLRLVSTPVGIVDQTLVAAPGTTLTTPDLKDSIYANHRFVFWDLEGARQSDPAGVSLSRFSFTSATAGRFTATAHYADSRVDDDFDGILDWIELLNFGTTAPGAGDDSDGDGMTMTFELFRGYSPRVRDTLAAGGVSRRRSLLMAVNTVQLPMPPIVTLNAATQVTSSSAQLNALVNPAGSAATVFFEHGPATAYGTQTPVQNLIGALGPVPVTAAATGLQAATVYHYRVVAENANGVTVTPDATFSTLWGASVAESFEDGSAASRWQVTGGGWQVGAPVHGPGGAHGGAACAGTGLLGDYPPNADSRLISPLFAVPALDQTPQLRFSHWWSFAPGDFGTIEVREGTVGAWQPLATYGSPVRQWLETSLDLSAFAGKNVQVAFRLRSNADAAVDAGWFVDDVGLVTGQLQLWDGQPAATFAPETFWSDWTVVGYGWECGGPASGPGRAFEGETCAGTTLGGDYADGADTRLASRFFLVPAAVQNPRLRYWQWHSFGPGDRGEVEIRALGGRWQSLKTFSGSGGASWNKPAIDLAAFAGAVVQVGFRLAADAHGTAPGWYVDAVQVATGPDLLNNPETFDGDVGDWYLDVAGIWQIGQPTSGPGSAHSGANVVATVLGGGYPASSSAILQSPAFTIGDPGSGMLIGLRFWEWHEYGAGDGGELLLSQFDGAVWSAWTPLPFAVSGTSGGWQQESVNLTAYRGKTIRVGFRHFADGDASTGAGWYLDDVEVTTLVLGAFAPGTGMSNTLDIDGARHYYTLGIAEGGPLTLTLDLAGVGADASLYLRCGALPTLGEYDFRVGGGGGGSLEILVPHAAPGTCYVMVYADAVTVPTDYTLRAVPTPLAVSAVSPGQLSEGSAVTLTVSGAGFSPGTTAMLVDSGGNTLPADTVEVDSFSQLTATFVPAAVPPDRYGVRVRRTDGATAERADAFTVTAAGKPEFYARLVVPQSIRREFIPVALYVEYGNTGTAAMPAPLLVVHGSDRARMNFHGGYASGPLYEVVSRRALPPLASAAMVNACVRMALPDVKAADTIQFMGGGTTPGLLQPGESFRIPIWFLGLEQPWDMAVSQVRFGLSALTADNTTAVNWGTMKSGMRPPTMSSEAWDPIWAAFVEQVGTTWGDYVRMLTANATYLSRLGIHMTQYAPGAMDVGLLLPFQFLQVDGLSPLPTLASAVDAEVDTPGLPLAFARSFSSRISQRNERGPLGYGWSHSWQIRREVDSQGNVTIRLPAGGRRVFRRYARTWDPLVPYAYYPEDHGDHGKLEAMGGGAFTLREPGGTISVFRSDGKLGYVEDTNGNRITALYTGSLLTGLTHSSGRSLQIEYDGSSRITRVSDSVGRSTRYTYDATGRHLASVQRHDGTVTAYGYSLDEGIARRHALASVTAPDGTRRLFSWNDSGRLKTVSRDAGRERVDFGYGTGRVTATDAAGATTRTWFDSKGRLVKSEDPLGRTVGLAYDWMGNLARVTDPIGQHADSWHDRSGRVGVTRDQQVNYTRFTYVDSPSRLSRLLDANGNATLHDYDPAGNLTAMTYADGSAEDWTHDAAGNPSQWVNRRDQGVTYVHDADGRLTAKLFPDGTRADYEYDARGNMTAATNDAGRIEMTYDVADRLQRLTYPGERWLEYAYDAAGRRTSMTDQLGYRLDYSFDADGRLGRVTDASGAPLVTYGYDAVGRLEVKTLGNGVASVYGYDASGQLLRLENKRPDGSTLSFFAYTYDARGRRTAMATHYGTWTYEYDDLGQLTRASLASADPGTVPDQDLRYTHDALGNRTRTVENGVATDYASNSLNQYTQVGDETLIYDADGSLIEKRVGETTTMTLATNAENRVTAYASAGGTRQYEYDALGFPSVVVRDGVRHYQVHDPAGFGNLVGVYDSSGALMERQVHAFGAISIADGSTPRYLTFDGVGNASEATGAFGDPTASQAYRPFGERLLPAGGALSQIGFGGEFGVMHEANLVYMRARLLDVNSGSFSSRDPVGLRGGDENLYRYVRNSPTRFIDPSGLLLVMVGNSVSGSTRGKGLSGGRYLAWDGSSFMPKVVTTKGGGFTTGSGFQAGKEILITLGNATIDDLVKNPASTSIGMSAGGNNIYGSVSVDDGANLTLGFGVGINVGTDVYITGTESTVSNPTNYDFNSMLSGEPLSIGLLLSELLSSLDSRRVPIFTPRDPNNLIGPAGYGPRHFVSAASLLPYTINFENAADATAPAQQVVVTNPLSDDLDWSTFELTEIAFGDQFVAVPPGRRRFETSIPVTFNGVTFEVQIEAGIDRASGLVYASFRSLDPSTGLPPPGEAGFLPPEDGSGRGQGHVTYVVNSKAGLPSGTEIRNVARIVFDGQPAIATDQVDPHDPSQGTDPERQALVTIDGSLPSSRVEPLPTSSTSPFAVSWTGDDGSGAGVAQYDVYVSQDAGPYTLWLAGTAAAGAAFDGVAGSTYRFYSIAVDGAGNREDAPFEADAETFVTGANLLPATADAAAGTAEDADLVLAPGDFPFSDADAGDALQAVRIVSLPLAGTLYRDADRDALVGAGEDVVAGSDVAIPVLAAGELRFKPAANEHGVPYAAFTFRVHDGTSYSAVATMTIDVALVNDAPTFVKGADQLLLTSAGAQTVPGWATGMSAGPEDEAGQSIAFQVTNDREALFAEQPAVSPDGTLTYSIAPGETGWAKVAVILRDDGGTANGGVDASEPQTFSIAVGDDRPYAVAAVEPAIVHCPTEVIFDGRSSYHGGSSHRNTAHDWDLHYAGTFTEEASGTTARISYGEVGTFTAALRVTDDSDPPQSDLATVTVTVVDREPVAHAGGPYAVPAGRALTLDGSASADADAACADAIAEYAWDLDGDGVYAEGSGVTLNVGWARVEKLICGGTCAAGGVHTVGLQVSDRFGMAGTATTTVRIGAPASHLSLTWPNGGEMLGTGRAQGLRWKAGPKVATVRLFLSADGGRKWSRVTPAVKASLGVATWTPPASSYRETRRVYLMRAVGYDRTGAVVARDASDGRFGIGPLDLTHPDGGEEFAGGTVQNATWVKYGTASVVGSTKFKYSLNGGETWRAVRIGAKPVRYRWTLPRPSARVPKALARVELYGADNALLGRDTSEGSFAVLGPVDLLAPESGDSVYGGTSRTISWATMTAAVADSVVLRLTRDDGATWTDLATLSGNPGNWHWRAPDVAAAEPLCRLEVTLFDADGAAIATDRGEGVFAIVPQP